MRRIRFADFELNLDLYELTKRGEAVHIGARPLDLLICLIENQERIVGKEFLRIEVWNSAALSASTIPMCVLDLRKALGDSARNPRIIESVRGRGYRFISEVTRSPEMLRSSIADVEELLFVGRRFEMEALRQSLRNVSTGKQARIVMLTGEAGIGKTRLLQEFTTSARGKADSLVARIPLTDGVPAFWPWTQSLRVALQQFGAHNPELAANAQRLATAFPEILGAVNPTFTPPVSLDRFSIINQWIRTVRSIPTDRPLILAFEDIHRADADSLALLSCLAEELQNEPILLITTHRPPPFDDDRLTRIAEIADVPEAIALELPPLTAPEISSMLDPLEGDRTVISEALASRSHGNAFFVTHLIRYLDSRATSASAELLVEKLPLNGREILTRQLSDLPLATRKTLSTASVIGDRFSIQSLSHLMETSIAETVAVLEPAARAWIIREEESEYAFSHSLLRDALYHSLDSQPRRAAHLALGRELSRRNDGHLRAAQISDHLSSAMPLTPHDEASRYALLAAREAASRFAFAEATTFLTRALLLYQEDKYTDPSRQGEIMQELAKAMLYAGDRENARSLLLEAAHIARTTASPLALASCALDLAPDFLTIEVGVFDSVLVGLLEEALACIDSEDSALRAKLLARLSQAYQWAGTRDRNESLAIESLSLARQISDPTALLAALAARAEALHGPSRAHERMRFISELGLVARRSGNIPAILLQQTRLITALLETGDIRQLEIENERYREVATSTALPQYRWYSGATDTMLAMLRGDIEIAEEMALTYRKAVGNDPDANFLQTFACQAALRAIEDDRAAEIVGLAKQFARNHKSVYSWSALIPWLHWEIGEDDTARDLLSTFNERDVELMFREAGGGVGIALLAEAISMTGERSHAEAMYRLVSPLSSCCASAGYGVAYFGSFARYAGLLARSLGMLDEAAALLSIACRTELEHRAPSWFAYSQIDLALTLNERGDSVEHAAHHLEIAKKRLAGKSLRRASRKLQEAEVAVEARSSRTLFALPRQNGRQDSV